MSLRTERVASAIKEEVGQYVARECRDPSCGLITVTDVQVSPDLRIAKLYVSVLGTPEVKAATMKALGNRRKEIRAIVGSHVRLKFTPEIHIYLDETLDRVASIERLIRRIHENDGSKSH